MVSSRLGRLNGRRNRIVDVDLRQQLDAVESLSQLAVNAYTRLMARTLSERPEDLCQLLLFGLGQNCYDGLGRANFTRGRSWYTLMARIATGLIYSGGPRNFFHGGRKFLWSVVYR
ncbi:hypothetical protein L1987_22867 [Smallanthus sonchifolius]|uniref:Uncharacterized protein n=1 Tax=Smallanthus sonchifolius TaxID=185202 RepID=A0ACB9IFC1_9ASTR|nr:hypothetical protein L1987_22867 [Smallanthus sonchifolius]